MNKKMSWISDNGQFLSYDVSEV